MKFKTRRFTQSSPRKQNVSSSKYQSNRYTRSSQQRSGKSQQKWFQRGGGKGTGEDRSNDELWYSIENEVNVPNDINVSLFKYSANNSRNSYSRVFKFLMFDPYIQQGDGAGSFIVATDVANFLDQYITINKFRPANIISPSFLPYFNVFMSYFPITSMAYNKDIYMSKEQYSGLYYKTVESYRNDILKFLYWNPICVLLSGFSSEDGGHAVIFYIKKEVSMISSVFYKQYYTFSIVNSGVGVNRHGLMRDLTAPIVIEFKHLTLEQIKKIIDIHYVANVETFWRDMYMRKLSREDQRGSKIDSSYLNEDPVMRLTMELLASYDESIRKNNYKMNMTFVYDELFKIVGTPIESNIVAYDVPQRTGSCTFFSIYFFYKHFIIADNSKFDEFVRFMRKQEISEFATVFNAINKNGYISNSRDHRNLVTISEVLLKDYESSFELPVKENVLTNISNAYSKFYNSIRGNIEPKSNLKKEDTEIEKIVPAISKYMTNPKTFDTLKECLDILKINTYQSITYKKYSFSKEEETKFINVGIGSTDPLIGNTKLAIVVQSLRIKCIRALGRDINSSPKTIIDDTYTISDATPGYTLLKTVEPLHQFAIVELFLLLGCIVSQFKTVDDLPLKYTKVDSPNHIEIINIVDNWYKDISNPDDNSGLNILGLIPIKHIFLKIIDIIPCFIVKKPNPDPSGKPEIVSGFIDCFLQKWIDNGNKWGDSPFIRFMAPNLNSYYSKQIWTTENKIGCELVIRITPESLDDDEIKKELAHVSILDELNTLSLIVHEINEKTVLFELSPSLLKLFCENSFDSQHYWKNRNRDTITFTVMNLISFTPNESFGPYSYIQRFVITIMNMLNISTFLEIDVATKLSLYNFDIILFLLYIYRRDELLKILPNNIEYYKQIKKDTSMMKKLILDKDASCLLQKITNVESPNLQEELYMVYNLINSDIYETNIELFNTYITSLFIGCTSPQVYEEIANETIRFEHPLNRLFIDSLVYQVDTIPNTFHIKMPAFDFNIQYDAATSTITKMFEIPNVADPVQYKYYEETNISMKDLYGQENVDNIQLLLLLKLQCIFRTVIWKRIIKYQYRLRIELPYDTKSYFTYNSSSNKKIKFIASNGTEYNVVTDYSALPGLWVYNMTNGFILEKNNIYSLLLFMKRDYIKSILFDRKKCILTDYWNENANKLVLNNMKRTIMNIPYKEHIIEFHHSLLSFKTSSFEDMSAIYISLWIAQNNMGLFLLRQPFLIIYENSDLSTNLYDIKAFREILKVPDSIDEPTAMNLHIPYWALFHIERDIISYDMKNRTDVLTFKDTASFINRTYDFTDILSMPQYNLIKEFSEDFYKIKQSFATTNGSTILRKFLDDFRYKCQPYESSRNDSVFDDIMHKIYPTIEYTRTNNITKSSSAILKELILTNKQLPHLIGIYSIFYKELYQNLIDLLFLESIKKVHKLAKPDELKDKLKTCGCVLKEIEYLDSRLIYGFDQKRETEDILFEIQSRSFLRAEQKETINTIYNNVSNGPVNSHTAYEILMGRGKTSTLTPLLILKRYLSTTTKDYSVVLPAHLIDQSFKILLERLIMLPTIMIHRFSERIDSTLSGERLQKKYQKYPNSINILSDSVIKEIVLKSRIDSLWNDPKKHMFVFDEVDSIIHPLKSDLNVPNGKQEAHPQLNTLFRICFETLKQYFQPSGAGVVSSSGTIQINHPVTNQLLYSETMSDLEVVPILNEKINHTLKNIHNSMKYNQLYGFGTVMNGPILPQKNHFVAIPYAANRKPVDGSEFTDFELAMMTTILSYFHEKIRETDILLEVTIILKRIKPFLGNAILKDAILVKVAESLLQFIPLKQLNDTLDMLQRNEPINDSCKTIATLINNSDKFYEYVHTYIKNTILVYYFNIFRTQDNISMLDVYSPGVSDKKISFSGTVNFNIPGDIIKNQLLQDSEVVKTEYYDGQITDIKIDEMVEGSIEASIYGTTTTPPVMIKCDKIDQEEIEIDLLEKIKQSNGAYSALIDGGGFFLKRTPLDVIREIKDSLGPDRTILYIDNTGKRQIYNQKDGTSSPYNDDVFSNLFIYYDNKHCVGIDFKQPFEMKGLVTISTKNNLSEIAQAIFRLRHINIGHYVDFYYDARINTVNPSGAAAPSADLTAETLYEFLKKNDEEIKKSTLDSAKLQCAKYCNRVNQLYNKMAYHETIYYDSIKTADIYLTEQEFINNVITNLSVKCKPISIVVGAPKQHVEVDVEVDVDVNVNIQIQQVRAYSPISGDIDIENKYRSIQLSLRNYYTTGMKNYDGTCQRILFGGSDVTDMLLTFGEFTLEISPPLLYYLQKQMIKTYENIVHVLNEKQIPLGRKIRNISIEDLYNIELTKNCYFIYNSSQPNNLRMINIFEFISIYNLSNLTSYDDDFDIIIYNSFAKPIFHKYRKGATPISVPPMNIIFQILLCKNYTPVSHIFHMFKNNPMPINKIKFFETFFKNVYDFTLTDASTFNPENYNDWFTLFNIPKITDDTLGIQSTIFKLLCDEYNSLYPAEKITYTPVPGSIDSTAGAAPAAATAVPAEAIAKRRFNRTRKRKSITMLEE
jgi:hypothetical protein